MTLPQSKKISFNEKDDTVTHSINPFTNNPLYVNPKKGLNSQIGEEKKGEQLELGNISNILQQISDTNRNDNFFLSISRTQENLKEVKGFTVPNNGRKNSSLNSSLQSESKIPQTIKQRQSIFRRNLNQSEKVNNSELSHDERKIPEQRKSKKSPMTEKKKIASPKMSKERAKKHTEYFGSDQDQDPLRTKEFDIVFKYRQFFEFLFYHFVFFFVLGPFSFIILYPTAGRLLTKNMGFSGLNTMFFNQTFQWLLLFSSACLWILTDHGNISSVEVYMIASAVFLRICTISSKYGSMHPVRIKILKSRYLSYEELTQDYMLIKWRNQTDDIIEQELVATIKRHDIDTSLFFFNFLADIDEETRKKLTDPKKGSSDEIKKVVVTEFLGSQSDEDIKNPAEYSKPPTGLIEEKKSITLTK